MRGGIKESCPAPFDCAEASQDVIQPLQTGTVGPDQCEWLAFAVRVCLSCSHGVVRSADIFFDPCEVNLFGFQLTLLMGFLADLCMNAAGSFQSKGSSWLATVPGTEKVVWVCALWASPSQ